MNLGHYSLALQYASEHIELNPNDILNRLSIAVCHAKLGNIDVSLMTLITALSMMAEAKDITLYLQNAFKNNVHKEQV